ncbi:unnamed protein product [Hymenolepis diminuta]|uniref:Uncharacterized protein n=1 Tax=Hymenolepis diminuta TaxID=6216 RepID=A0A0R3S9Y4_HYMDI|nr:unnamed protein product [Hymenolepis diminuta]
MHTIKFVYLIWIGRIVLASRFNKHYSCIIGQPRESLCLRGKTNILGSI